MLRMQPTQSNSSMLRQPVASSIVEVRPLSTPLAAYTAEGLREWGHLALTRAIVEATELVVSRHGGFHRSVSKSYSYCHLRLRI
jgi:hypothetical protein